MPHRGRTTSILLATGAVVVALVAVVSFRGNVQSDAERIRGECNDNEAANSIIRQRDRAI